jgi:hypothetical protein
VLFEGANADQVTPLVKLPVPVTVAANCNVVPMVTAAGFGVTFTEVMVGCAGGGVDIEPHPPQAVIVRVKSGPAQTAAEQPSLITGQ